MKSLSAQLNVAEQTKIELVELLVPYLRKSNIRLDNQKDKVLDILQTKHIDDIPFIFLIKLVELLAQHKKYASKLIKHKLQIILEYKSNDLQEINNDNQLIHYVINLYQLNILSPTIKNDWLNCLFNHLDSLNEKNITNSIYALSTSSIQVNQIWLGEWLDRSFHLMHDLSAKNLAIIMCSLAKLNIKIEKEWLEKWYKADDSRMKCNTGTYTFIPSFIWSQEI